MNYSTLTLKRGKERALDRRHPWVFSGAFAQIPDSLTDGQIVKVEDAQKKFRAIGFFRKGSIAVQILSFEEVASIEELLHQRISAAAAYREQLGLTHLSGTNCLRLIFAEGDGLPGLIVDKYGSLAVAQFHHTGWFAFTEVISKALKDTGLFHQIGFKPSEKLVSPPGFEPNPDKADSKVEITEYGHRFLVDWIQGQKTGFFIDQRENRRLLGSYSAGKEVLNTFSYTGGFSIYALAGNATRAVSVDISQSAIDLANENAHLNGMEANHHGVASDVFDYLKSEGSRFDVIVLDPPAFSKSKRTAHNAVQAYKRLNALALKKIKKGGLIFSFSCSQHINAQLFGDTLRAAAIEARRPTRLIQKLSQPADHPVNIFHPEGEYLKGAILQVD